MYGNDKIFSGSNLTGARLRIFGDTYRNAAVTLDSGYRGSPNDGDDIIDVGDSPGITGNIRVFGQGGNDKIFGSLGIEEKLEGGDGDDKIWAENPGQVETEDDVNEILGNNGNDIIYGSIKKDKLYGDWARDSVDATINPAGRRKYDTEGGDDIIYTGVSIDGAEDGGGDYVHGGWGDDKIYGQGVAYHSLYGEFGDDMIWGGDGNDNIYGDDYNSNSSERIFADANPANPRFTSIDYGVMSGNDTLYGGKGSDYMHGGAGDDYIHGEDDADFLYGDGGEDTLWGGDGDDIIYTGTGWDTVFGGDGCDLIYS